MSLVEESFGHRSLENRYSSSSNCGCRESQEHRSLETSHTSSSNCGGCGCRSSMTSHSHSRNHGGCADICGSRLEDTRNYSSCNWEKIFHVEGRGGYMYLTSHHLPPNQSERGTLLTFSGDNFGGDGRVGYIYHTIHYSC